MRDRFLVFGAPEISEFDLDAVISTFRSGWIGTGPITAELEQAFAAYTGSPHAMALSSCTAALHLAMLTAGLQPGDEVITTPMTFCATANAIIHAQGVPVFADVDPLTGLISPQEIERHITPNTRAILPVHLEGRACAMREIMEIAWRHHLFVIEDCAHAIETLYENRHAGTFGDAGCFSFYVTKNVVGIEGGMFITHHGDRANRVKTLALNGMSADAWARFSDAGYKHYQVTDAGYKYNLPDVHSALALSQLKRVEENLARRREIWSRYDKAFIGLPCYIPQPEEPGTRHARHLYRLILKTEELKISRDDFLQEMQHRNIGCGVHYLSLHLHQYYRDRFDLSSGDYPSALWLSERTVSLPLSPKLTDEDIGDVIESVTEILCENSTSSS